jgi:hypothetical protein
MRDSMRRLVQAYGGWRDIVVDAHVYGGGAVAAIGVALWSPPGLGIALFGGLLVFLGLRSA